MDYRTATLLAATDVGAAGTKDVEINVAEPISSIEITFKTTKASQGMSAGSPANISKIEILDGSDRLASITGYEAQALGYYNRPTRVLSHGQHISTLSEFDTYPIDFGRWLWDERLALDPSKFTNLMLKITWDEDVSDTSVTANEMEVLAHLFDEKVVNPEGFLSPIEEYDYTLGADNSFETIKLPDDMTIRQMLVRAYQDGYEPWYSIDEIRFDENGLKRIPFEFTNLENYYRRMKSHWSLIALQVALISDVGGKTFYIPQTDYYANGVFIGLGGTTEVYNTNASSRGGKLAITGSGAINIAGITFGYLPWHCYQFDMGISNNIEDWYNPLGKAPRVRLRASTGATSSTGQIILEKLRRYQ